MAEYPSIDKVASTEMWTMLSHLFEVTKTQNSSSMFAELNASDNDG